MEVIQLILNIKRGNCVPVPSPNNPFFELKLQSGLLTWLIAWYTYGQYNNLWTCQWGICRSSDILPGLIIRFRCSISIFQHRAIRTVNHYVYPFCPQQRGNNNGDYTPGLAGVKGSVDLPYFRKCKIISYCQISDRTPALGFDNRWILLKQTLVSLHPFGKKICRTEQSPLSYLRLSRVLFR